MYEVFLNLIIVGIVLFENDEFISQEIPYERSDGGDGGADIAEALRVDFGISKDSDYDIGQYGIYYESDYADQEKTSEFLVAGFVLAAECPMLVPEIATDIGNYERDRFESYESYSGSYAGCGHQDIKDSPIEKSVESADGGKFGDLQDDWNEFCNEGGNNNGDICQNGKGDHYQNISQSVKRQEGEVDIYEDRNRKKPERNSNKSYENKISSGELVICFHFFI